MNAYFVTRTVTWCFPVRAEDEEDAREIVQSNIKEFEDKFYSNATEDWDIEEDLF